MEAKWKGLSLVAIVAVAFVLALSGLASAAGSGYNQSFSQSANGSNVNSDLTSVSTNDPGGLNLTTSFTVAGQVILNSDTYIYEIWYGGSSASNATAYAFFSNNTTAGFYAGYGSNAGSFGYLPFTVSGGGSTLTFSIAKTILPPASSFTLNAVAVYGSTGSYSYSWLGNNFNGLGGGGGGTCTGSSCTVTSSSSSFNWLIVIIPVIVIVVVVVVVLVLLMRKKRPTQPAMMGQPGGPMMGAPGQPAWGAPPPPPSGQPYGQSPPPPGSM